MHNLISKFFSLLLGLLLFVPVAANATNTTDKVSLSAVVRTREGGLTLIKDAVYTNAVEATLLRWDLEYNVVSSGVNAKRSIFKDVLDPEISNQWGYTRLGGSTLNEHTQGEGIVVAVIDTGVDAMHPDLRGKVLQGWDSMNPDGNGNRDPNGHGTHVAGIIAATTNNGIGVAGIAPKVSILPVRVLDHTGNGDDGELALGIIWAVDNGAHVLNISIGGAVPSDLLEGALDYALAKEVVVVVAAGNDAMIGNTPSYPGAYKQVLTVGATDSMDKRAAFSNTGEYLDLVAPGSWIKSTWPGGGYQWSSGTSMAAPFVAASAALLLSSGAGTGSNVASILKSSALDLGPEGEDTEFGNGLVNPLKALGLPEIPLPVSTTPFMPSLLTPGLVLPDLPDLPQLPPLIKPTLPSLPKLSLPKLPPLPALTKPQLPALTRPQIPESSKPQPILKPNVPITALPTTPPSLDLTQPVLSKSGKHSVTISTKANKVGGMLSVTIHLKGLRSLTAYAEVHVVYGGKTYKLRTNARSTVSLKVAYHSKNYIVVLKESPFIAETTATMSV